MTELNAEQHWAELDLDLPIEHHSLYRKIDAILSGRTPGSLLEVGCLDGRFLRHVEARGWSVAGIDLQPQAAPYIIEHDATHPFPFEGGSFDVVVAAEVVEHVVDTKGFLRNCADVLRPGGILILTTPNLLFGVNRLRMLIGRRPLFAYADFHVRMFVWDDLRAKLEDRFTVQNLRGSHVLLGRRHGAWTEPFSRLADRAPKLSAHFIVTAQRIS